MKPIRNSIKAIIIRDHQLLAIKKEDENGFYYILPGGGQEKDETFHVALKRECLEEIGVDILIGELRYIREYLGKNHGIAHVDYDAHQVEFMFLCHLADGAEPRSGTSPDEGQVAVEWIELGKLNDCRFYPMALRPILSSWMRTAVPVYLGDVN